MSKHRMQLETKLRGARCSKVRAWLKRGFLVFVSHRMFCSVLQVEALSRRIMAERTKTIAEQTAASSHVPTSTAPTDPLTDSMEEVHALAHYTES
jgi:hypothetical protein